MVKRLNCLLLIFILVFSVSTSVSAKSIASNSYQGYQYNSDNTSTAAPIGYIAESIISGKDISLETPLSDNILFSPDESNVEQTKFFFIDKNRIIVTDADLCIVSIVENFVDENGSKIDISGAISVAADFESGKMLLAFREKILVFDLTGRLRSTIDSLVAVNGVFSPQKVLFARGEFYILDSSAKYGYYTSLSDNGEMSYNHLNRSITDICYDAISDCVYALSEDGGILNLTMESDVVSPSAIDGNLLAYSSSEDVYYVAFDNEVRAISSDGELVESAQFNEKVTGITFSSERELLVIKTDSGTKLEFYQDLSSFVEAKSQISISFKAPSDILYDNIDTVYVLDSGNGRIVSLDTSFKKIKAIYSNFITEDGKKLDITEAQGLYVKDGTIYIADTTNYRVVLSDMAGRVKKQIFKPEQLEKSVEVPFRAIKVILDNKNKMYVLSDSINMGALVFDAEGKFESFFGSNEVTVTKDVVVNYIKKKLLTKEQTKGLQKYTPISLANFDMDNRGFLFTVTSTDQIRVANDFSDTVRKLNYSGDNVFNTDFGKLSFGDVEWDRQNTVTNTSFVDIDIDKDGFIFTLDASRGKVFQYSEEGQFLSVFAGLGNQIGLFSKPSAIETINGKVYVIDAITGNITSFTETEYGALLKKATLSLKSNRPDESIELWNQVLRFNTNNEYAYYGLGIAYEAKGDYENAMKNFRLAESRSEYSKAFREYRKVYARDNIWWILLIGISIVFATVFLVKKMKSRMIAIHGTAYSALETKKGLPIYVLFHPIDGFSQFRQRKLQSMPISIGIVIAFFFLKVLEFFCTGFAFNPNKAVNYDLLSSLAVTVLLFALFVFATWAINTFLDGKGKLDEIVAVTAYSLTPYLTSILINILLSNILTLQESAFLSIFTAIGLVWSGLVLIMGMYTVQEYSFTKTIVSLVLSVIGMIIITLVIMLFFSLMQQSISYLYSIFYELKLR